MKRTPLKRKTPLRAKSSLRSSSKLSAKQSLKAGKTGLKRRSLSTKTSLKKRGKSDKAKAKAEAWKSFSRYIRTRDCLRFCAKPDTGMCVTCKNEFPYAKLQAGHFIQGRGNAVLFDERIVYSQCLTAESSLRMFNGQSKSIADIVVGDRLWAFNEIDHSLEVAEVEQASSFVPEKLYKVELEDGSVFYATPDHRVVANGKWVFIEDMLHSVSTYDILEL